MQVIDNYRKEGVQSVFRALTHRFAGAIGGRDYRISLYPRVHPVKLALQEVRRAGSFCVVQVGAFTGDTDSDPIFEMLQGDFDGRGLATRCKIVLIEPVREYFEKLRENYREVEGVSFENVAIAEESGERDFYRLGVDPVECGYPAWLSQLGSLRADRMNELWRKYENDEKLRQFYLDNMTVEKVTCITFEELLQRHQIQELDLLQIDTEGYDYEILKTIDFGRVLPRYINYERVLLQEDEPACRALVESAGYGLVDYGQDTFCVRKRWRHSAAQGLVNLIGTGESAPPAPAMDESGFETGRAEAE